MSTPNAEKIYNKIYQEEYDAVLEECPEYSDSSSYQYDLSWCHTLAAERADRIYERGDYPQGGED